MSDSSTSALGADLGADFGSMSGRKKHVDPEFDITAMIDLVFMLNIFFLVTSVGAVMAQPNLPAARNVTAADEANSVIITVLINGDPKSPTVFIGQEGEGPGITDFEEQAERIQQAVEQGLRDNKTSVLIKAEEKVRFG